MAQSFLPRDSFLVKPLTPRNSLNILAVDKLQPTQEFNDKCGRDIDMLCQFLRSRISGVAQVLVGGSLKKGTALRGNADIDAVLFLNRFHNMLDYRANLSVVIEELKTVVKEYTRQEFIVLDGQTGKALKLKLRRRLSDEFIDVDLLPAFNNLAAPGKDAVYCAMNDEEPRNREFYSSSLASLQLEFVTSRVKDNTQLKNLIRVVKHWRKTCFPSKSSSMKFPTSYVLELITIYCWERVRSPATFNMEKAFKGVMHQIVDYATLNIYWSDNYRREHYTKAAGEEPNRPYVLDPANPFNNVCLRFADSWPEVSKLARESYNSPLLSSVVFNEHSWAN